jgi:hypothetical protein
VVRRERWILFHHTVTFTPLPPGTPLPFQVPQKSASLPEIPPLGAGTLPV